MSCGERWPIRVSAAAVLGLGIIGWWMIYEIEGDHQMLSLTLGSLPDSILPDFDRLFQMHGHGGRRTLYTYWKHIQRERPNGGWYVDDRPPFGRQQTRYAARMAAKQNSRRLSVKRGDLRKVRKHNRNRVVHKPVIQKAESRAAATAERLRAVAIQRGDRTHAWESGEGSHQQLRDSLAGPHAFLTERKPGDIEGFVTTTGRFVDRREAQHVALLAGQIDRPQSRELLSSDINWDAGMKAAA